MVYFTSSWTEKGSRLCAVRKGRWKKHFSRDGEIVDELYDLEADPGEKENPVSDPSLGELLAGLRKRLLEDLTSHGDPFAKSAWLRHQLLDGRIVPPEPAGKGNP